MIKWLGYRFASSSGLTEEYTKFAREFKAWIKKNLPEGAELVKFNRGHFYVSGFIKRGEKYAYFMSSDIRFFPDKWYNELMIRTAKSDKDFTGGRNFYCSLQTFTSAVNNLLNM